MNPKQELRPCAPYPDDAAYKSIAVRCDACDTCECWTAYLSWEKRVCPDFAERRTTEALWQIANCTGTPEERAAECQRIARELVGWRPL
jgi:hypothetical protein